MTENMQSSDVVTSSKALLSLAPAGLAAMMVGPQLQAAAIKNLMSHQSEAVAFWQNRFKADLELAQELVTAKTMAEYYSALVDFWEETVTEYVSEASLLAGPQPDGRSPAAMATAPPGRERPPISPHRPAWASRSGSSARALRPIRNSRETSAHADIAHRNRYSFVALPRAFPWKSR